MISDKGVLNPKVLQILKDDNLKYLENEMLKIIDELYWDYKNEHEVLTSFIIEFFAQYEPEKEYTDEQILDWRSGIRLD